MASGAREKLAVTRENGKPSSSSSLLASYRADASRATPTKSHLFCRLEEIGGVVFVQDTKGFVEDRNQFGTAHARRIGWSCGSREGRRKSQMKGRIHIFM